ncbi:MAG TPA: DoxX family protein [Woeseiaceae bacterium]|nr:DoxX family protein [Woeseiaceae bacterium]
MKSKDKQRIGYWVATALFALPLVMDGLGGVMHVQAGIDGVTHLGYPVYLLSIIGTGKLLAAVAVLQTRFSTVKEWAFAGMQSRIDVELPPVPATR